MNRMRLRHQRTASIRERESTSLGDNKLLAIDKKRFVSFHLIRGVLSGIQLEYQFMVDPHSSPASKIWEIIKSCLIIKN